MKVSMIGSCTDIDEVIVSLSASSTVVILLINCCFRILIAFLCLANLGGAGRDS